MDEKRATVLLLLVFGAVFVYSVVMRDSLQSGAAVRGVEFEEALTRDGGRIVPISDVPRVQENALLSHQAALEAAFKAASQGKSFASFASLPVAGVTTTPSSSSPTAAVMQAFQGKPFGSFATLPKGG